jgi:hypothetical protein
VGLSELARPGVRLAPYPGGSGFFVAISWLFTLSAAEAARPRYDRFARALKTATGLRQVSAISDSFSYLLFQRLKSGVAHLFFIHAPSTSS